MKKKSEIRTLVSIIGFMQGVCAELAKDINDRVNEYKSDGRYSSLEGIALNLMHFYNEIEAILTRIAKDVDESLPSGGSWHNELLQQMVTEIVDTRLPVLSKGTYEILSEYKNFRHKVYKNAGIKLKWEDLKKIAEKTSNTLAIFDKDLAKFKEFLIEISK